jgi:hypothetical protein
LIDHLQETPSLLPSLDGFGNRIFRMVALKNCSPPLGRRPAADPQFCASLVRDYRNNCHARQSGIDSQPGSREYGKQTWCGFDIRKIS